MASLRPPKRVLGRRELIDFPDFALTAIEAKVDTGAYTSAIHCSDIRIEPDASGRPVLHVQLLDPEHPGVNGQPLAFAEFALRDIRSSNGEVQERYVIQAVVKLYGKLFTAEFSLSDRSDMKYPVLLGRSLLREGRFVVDVARRNLSYKAQVRAASRRTRP
ncbi:ATP-dependent zinc protease [Hymenobacter sedentarius]|uniref:ATP-dependent zinc protease n=1 Tax=Hymenobacter sedentarius TaxID=1411621 RepID=A0A0U4C0Q5_9BACT|nr:MULTISPECIES: RimK/LysX family protein [Hymenobacter]ALW83752.1 ATP-dependent zinc protease [Hymenobacter sedentarius]MCC3151661.1 RimK/LysX family protein [Hymenobacter sp. BT770]MDO3413761.1 RimK/LysX family protein [Hymenobacter sp. BT770]